MGRVGDDDSGSRHILHHAFAAAFYTHLTQFGAHLRVAFKLLVLVSQLLHGHTLLLPPLVLLPGVVERSDDRQNGNNADHDLDRHCVGHAHQSGRVENYNGVELVTVGPDDNQNDRRNDDQLGHALGEVDQAGHGKQPLEPGQRRNLRQLGLNRIP